MPDPTTPSGIMVHSDRGYCDRIAARLTARGVHVGCDLLAAAQAVFTAYDATQDTSGPQHSWDARVDAFHDAMEALRAALATPQPAEEEGR